MPPHLPTTRVGDYDLTEREIQTLKFIVEYVDRNPLHQPPTHQELVDHLKKVLPKVNGRPPVRSKQQTQRIAESLREMGLLVNAEEDILYRAPRNMVPEKEARRIVRLIYKMES